MKSFNTYRISAEHAGLTVEAYLKEILQFSGRRLQKLTRQKGILLNGKTVYLQRKVNPGDTLRVLASMDADYGVQPEKGVIQVLYEDDYLVVLNKPAGLLVHPAGQTRGGTLANYLAYHFKQCGIVCTIRAVHRLDRDTSGCVIFAKDPQTQSLMEQQLKDGLLRRTYQALAEGHVEPAAGIIDAPVGPHPTLPNRRAVTGKGERALTHYRTVRSFAGASLLELSLETGRTHQIRVHLAHIGHPVIGDGMYGKRAPWMARQALHAISVSFRHLKDNREITVEAPLADDFSLAIEACAKQPTT